MNVCVFFYLLQYRQEFEELDKNNDIGYYSVRCPNPLTNRDFVNQRAWRVKGNTYLCAFSSFFPLIFYFFFFFFFLSSHLYYLFHSHFDSLGYVIKNHSVNYPKCPEKKNFIRARSIRTGYYVVALESGGIWLSTHCFAAHFANTVYRMPIDLHDTKRP